MSEDKLPFHTDEFYTDEFYQDYVGGSRRSAREIIPLVLDLVEVNRVIDVGCGLGTWLSVFAEYGVKDVFGIDGDHIDMGMLEIPKSRFLPLDLKKPFRMDRQFDLVVSLEVAQNLPHECAAGFINCLTSLGPVILFSAAIPYQGGYYHINEQWPDYWSKHFLAKEYVVIDCIRQNVWQNDNVEWWYAQNTLIFAKKEYLENCPLLKMAAENTNTSQLSIVHPKKYLDAVEEQRLSLLRRDIVTLIPAGDAFILVDENRFASTDVTAGRKVIPFLERNGHYWGKPPDDETAIRELERLRQQGANFIVFAWPALWWLDYYSQLHEHLRSEFRCILESDRLIAFDLNRGAKPPANHRKANGPLGPGAKTDSQRRVSDH